MRAIFTMLFLLACTNSYAIEGKQVLKLSEHISIDVEIEEFDRAKHELFYCDAQHLCLIDGYPVFGTDGAVPKAEIKSLVLVANSKRISLNHKGMYNPWSPIEGKSLYIYIVDDSPNGLRLRGEFSDGAATYIVEWLVIGGGSARVLIDCVECVSRQFNHANQ